MSHAGLRSMARSVDEVKQVVSSLTDDEWERPSGCAGWSVKDLVAHMSSNYKEVVDPSPPPDEPLDLPAEAMMELLVDPRRDWTAEQVRDEYLAHCDAALEAMAALQEEPVASSPIAIADLGSYEMHQFADAFAFDHYCHLRIDLLAPLGPVERDLPPPDDELVGPAVGWMMAGLPKMQPGLHEQLDGRLRLDLDGPGAQVHDVVRDGDSLVVVAPTGSPDVTVRSSAHDFVRWGTRRMPWRDACRVDGDEAVAARFLDALDIV